VLEDDQVAVAAQTRAGVHDTAIGGGQHRSPARPRCRALVLLSSNRPARGARVASPGQSGLPPGPGCARGRRAPRARPRGRAARTLLAALAGGRQPMRADAARRHGATVAAGGAPGVAARPRAAPGPPRSRSGCPGCSSGRCRASSAGLQAMRISVSPGAPCSSPACPRSRARAGPGAVAGAWRGRAGRGGVRTLRSSTGAGVRRGDAQAASSAHASAIPATSCARARDSLC
jgi:hypothetical protein